MRRPGLLLALLAAAGGGVAPALGHSGAAAHPPGSLWSAWTLDPLVLMPLALAAGLYAGGTAVAWRRGGAGRGVEPWQAGCFAGGMLAACLALVWPLDVLGETLFSAHMAQHLVLMNLAGPLLVLGAPVQAMYRALPRGWQRGLGTAAQGRAWRKAWSWLTGAAVATVLQQGVMWTWHTPRGVAAALASDSVHIAMHVSLVAVALLFWTAVLRPRGRRYWPAVGALAVTLKVMGLISILLLLLPGERYPAYGDAAAAWGLSAGDDETLGWGLMMAFGMASYLAAAIALVWRALAALEGRYPAAAPRRAIASLERRTRARLLPGPRPKARIYKTL